MSVTYTNCKGLTYYLCKGVTKTGKPRYYFAREPRGEPVEQIPEGYAISESVNGVVSLVKDRPALVLPEEVAVVEAAVQQHPKAHNYRVSVKHDRIEIYEIVGPNWDELLFVLSRDFTIQPGLAERIRAERERYAHFTPVLRFILLDAAKRTFRTERWCYLGSIDDWIDVGPHGTVEQLARRWIPRLGSDAFLVDY